MDEKTIQHNGKIEKKECKIAKPNGIQQIKMDYSLHFLIGHICYSRIPLFRQREKFNIKMLLQVINLSSGRQIIFHHEQYY